MSLFTFIRGIVQGTRSTSSGGGPRTSSGGNSPAPGSSSSQGSENPHFGSGVDVRTVSERLGHADVATTLRVYAHAMPGRDEAAGRVMGEVERGLG